MITFLVCAKTRQKQTSAGFFSEISFFKGKMASKHSVAFAQEVLIRAALARRILVMAITPLSSGLTRCFHHIFGLRYH
jgi:hypothetical protein